MGKVVILDENTSNKIAAGEVVERPASVVKELVENSIDAGAGSITVDIRNGGISFIKVTDNGSGISEDDTVIAFERHSTSKIRSADDLEAISTMGFRGEALASIASVSSVELTTRTHDSEYGTYVKVQGGNLAESRQTGCPVGTTFIIRDLFYNTPARFKFLKKDTTEAGYISDTISRIALGNPGISFKLSSSGSTILHTPGNNDLLSTIFSVYGKDIARQVVEVKYEDNNIKIHGYVGKPEIARSNRNQQSFFVNGRYIKSKIVASALDEAYKTLLMKNKFPFSVLHMEINPIFVDINVHPSKLEARFANEQQIFSCIYHSVNNALLGRGTPLARNIQYSSSNNNIFKFQDRIPGKDEYIQQKIDTDTYKPTYQNKVTDNEIVKPIEQAGQNSDAKKEEAVYRKQENYNKNVILYDAKPVSDTIGYQNATTLAYKDSGTNTVSVKEIDDSDKNDYYEKVNNNERITEIKTDNSNTGSNENDESQLIYSKSQVQDDASKDSMDQDDKKIKTEEYENHKETVDNSRMELFENFKIIGQLFSTYILLEHTDEMILVDQHAAHERIMFEELKERYENHNPPIQYLLSPVIIELTHQELKFLEEKQDFFSKTGFIFEGFGNNSIILRATPGLDENTNVKKAFLDIVDQVMGSFKTDQTRDMDEAIHTIACKAAVKANNKLDDIEIESLLKRLELLKNPYTCPHGRPVFIKITKREFEKMFKRIV